MVMDKYVNKTKADFISQPLFCLKRYDKEKTAQPIDTNVEIGG